MTYFKIKTKQVRKINVEKGLSNNITESAGFKESVGTTRLIAKFIGIWPESEAKQNFFTRYYYMLPIILILTTCVIPQTRKGIIMRKDFNAVLEVISTGIIMHVIAILKTLGIRFNTSGLRELILIIAEDWEISSENEKEIMWECAKLSRFIVTFGLTFTIGNILSLMVRVPAVYYFDLQNLEGNETILKPMFLKSDFYYDVQGSPVYEILYVCQIVACFCVTFAFTSYDGFFVFSILHFSGQFYNLQCQIENLIVTQKKKKCSFMDVFVPLIERHRDLCRYTSVIEENFNKIFLIQMIATSIFLCLQGYEFASVFAKRGAEMLANLVFIACFITSNIVSILMYCYVAERLRTQSQKLFYSIFNIEWYDLPPNESKLLIIIMNRTKYPVEITVGKFVAFSLEYFCTVIKTSAGYLSVLLAMKDKL